MTSSFKCASENKKICFSLRSSLIVIEIYSKKQNKKIEKGFLVLLERAIIDPSLLLFLHHLYTISRRERIAVWDFIQKLRFRRRFWHQKQRDHREDLSNYYNIRVGCYDDASSSCMSRISWPPDWLAPRFNTARCSRQPLWWCVTYSLSFLRFDRVLVHVRPTAKKKEKKSRYNLLKHLSHAMSINVSSIQSQSAKEHANFKKNPFLFTTITSIALIAGLGTTSCAWK